MTTRLYIPCDSSAVAVGAESLARAVGAEATRRGLDVEIVRTGSRGLFWLEPMIEVATPKGRVAYGPVRSSDVAGLFGADFLAGASHPRLLGVADELPGIKRQTRLTFGRVGIVDPLSPDDYRRHGGLKGLERALDMTPAGICEEVIASGLRGRGGAGFPTGVKWRTVLNAPVKDAGHLRPRAQHGKYIVCNADEGDSGTFADRMMMEGDPFTLIEGMTIAALATGATKGFIYIRSEYPQAIATMNAALHAARDAGLLGASVLASGRAFDLEVRVGAGAYICGEETALLESLEGRRGQVRAKPPLPALQGLFGQPTVINNVLSLATAPWILAHGAKAYAALGEGRSRGTQPFQLAGNVKRGGLYELPLGITLREIVEDLGGGTRSGRPVRAVQVGGPLGAFFPDGLLDTRLDYESMLAQGGMLGHGGIVVFDDSVDMARQARFAMEFCAMESCGKCTPCRIGSTRGVETIDRIVGGEQRERNLALLDDLCALMTDASLCALGGLTPLPVTSALKHFRDDFLKGPAQ